MKENQFVRSWLSLHSHHLPLFKSPPLRLSKWIMRGVTRDFPSHFFLSLLFSFDCHWRGIKEQLEPCKYTAVDDAATSHT